MKKLMLAAAILAGAFAFGEESYTDWFTPAMPFASQVRTPSFSYMDGTTEKKLTLKDLNLDSDLTDCQAAVEDAVSTASMSASAKNAFMMAKISLASSIKALIDAERNSQEIESLGASIETIFSLTTADKVDSSGATISSGKLGEGMRGILLAKKNAVMGGKNPSEGEGGKDEPLKITVTDFSYDTHEFEQIAMNGNKSKMGLKGYKNLTPITTWPTTYPWLGSTALGYIPFSTGYTGGEPNDLSWKAWAGFDNNIFKESEKNGEAGRVTFVGWNEGTKCAETMSKMLTDETLAQDRLKHSVLTRYGQSGNFALHWVGIGDVIGGGAATDEASITTNTANGAIADKKSSLYGWTTANDTALTANEVQLPIADGSDELTWKGLSEMTDENVFETDDGDDGKLTIKGFNDAVAGAESDGEAYILNADPEDDDIHWTAASALFNSNVFTTDTDGKIIINGLDDYTTGDLMIISAQGEDTEQEVEGLKLDAGQFEKTTDGKLILKGSAAASATCSAPLNVMLSNESDTQNRQRHRLLALYTEGSNREFHWVPMTGTVGGFGTDEASVTTNTAHGAATQGKASLYGWTTALSSAEDGVPYLPFASSDEDEMQWQSFADFFDENEFQASDTDGKLQLAGFAEADEAAGEEEVPYIPCVDGAGSLYWNAFDGFFAENVFKVSESGKILLNGTSEDENNYAVIAIKGGNSDSQQVKTLSFDESSVDGNFNSNAPIQLHAFANAPSPYTGKNFADALTNTSVNIQGFSVPVRIPTGGKNNGPSVAYIPMGKVTGIPSANVDDVTIEINKADPNNEFLQLHGAAGEGITLNDGDVYAIKDGKGKFITVGADKDDEEVTAESASIETYTDEAGNKYFRLRDWMLNREGQPHLLGWEEHQLKYWAVDGGGGVEIEDGTAGDVVRLSGHDTANEGDIPYARKDGNGLGWLSGNERIPMLKSNAAPVGLAIGNSLDKDNVSAVPTLNVKGFTNGGNCSASLNDMLSKEGEASNRSAHKIMARYSSGGTTSVHWIPITGTIGGGADVDDKSITTNTAHGASISGKASVYGFSGATIGHVPYKKSANEIGWKKADGGFPTDEASVTTNYANGAAINLTESLYGWRTAQVGSVPQKGQNGKLTWFKASSATNIYLAGAGIQITDNGGGVSTISALDYNGSGGGQGGSTVTMTVITQCRYDEETHKFQIKTRNITFYGTAEDEDEEWTDIFEAVSHASEHDTSSSN